MLTRMPETDAVTGALSYGRERGPRWQLARRQKRMPDLAAPNAAATAVRAPPNKRHPQTPATMLTVRLRDMPQLRCCAPSPRWQSGAPFLQEDTHVRIAEDWIDGLRFCWRDLSCAGDRALRASQHRSHRDEPARARAGRLRSE